MPLFGSVRRSAGGSGDTTGNRKNRRLGSSTLFGTSPSKAVATANEEMPLSGGGSLIQGVGYGGLGGAASSSDTETVTTTTVDDWTIGSMSPVRLIQPTSRCRERLDAAAMSAVPHSPPATTTASTPPPNYSQVERLDACVQSSPHQREKQLQFSDADKSHVFYDEDDDDDGDEDEQNADAGNKRKKW